MTITFAQGVIGAGLAAMLAACGGGDADSTSASASSTAAPPARSAAPAKPMPVAAPPITAPTARATADTDAAVGDLRDQVRLLRREVAELRVQVGRLPRSDAAEAAPPDPRTDPLAREQAQDAERQRVAAAETAFRNEPSDPRWSQSTAASIQSAFGGVDTSLRDAVRSIECRSSSCRVELAADAGPALGQQLPVIIAQFGSALPRMNAGQVDQGDGRQATVLYLSR